MLAKNREIVEGQARKHRLQDVAPINFDQLKVQRLLFQAVQAAKEMLRLEFFNSFLVCSSLPSS